jgi:hypothetical protein
MAVKIAALAVVVQQAMSVAKMNFFGHVNMR